MYGALFMPQAANELGPPKNKFEQAHSELEAAPCHDHLPTSPLPLHWTSEQDYSGKQQSNFKMVQTSTIVAATVGTLATGFLGKNPPSPASNIVLMLLQHSM